MPRRTKNYRSMDEIGLTEPTDAMRAYCRDRYPNVDVDGTFENFQNNALSHDKVFADWDRAFYTWLRNGEKYGGLQYKSGMSDPAFAHLIPQARACGFRDPFPGESAGAYRTKLKDHDRAQASTQRVLSMAVRRFGGE